MYQHLQISVVHHINKSNNKNHMINRCQESIWPNTTSIHDTNLHKVSIEETSLILMKAIYDKPTANIIFK